MPALEAIQSLMEEAGALQSNVRQLRRGEPDPAAAPSATFLVDRAVFVQAVMRQIAIIERHGTPASLIYFCLESLARPLAATDEPSDRLVLAHIAEFLRRHVREGDVVGRLARNEFVVLLTHATEDQAQNKAEGLARSLREQIPSPLGMTLTFGAAGLRAGTTVET